MSTNIFLKEIKHCRKQLYSVNSRRKFWKGNKLNFEKNVQKIVSSLKFPKKWKVFVVLGDFLANKKALPFDRDTWSSTMVAAATKRQRFEIIMFINKTSSEFLSLPALIPLIAHEAQHAWQIARSPKNYVKTYFNDTLAQKDELDAEKNVRKLPQEFIDEAALESILYCYDIGGWNAAQKMADNLWTEVPEMYSGGYDAGMTETQYKLFLRTKKKKNIKEFIAKF